MAKKISLIVASIVYALLDIAYIVYFTVQYILILLGQSTMFDSFVPVTICVIVLNSLVIISLLLTQIFYKVFVKNRNKIS